MQHARLPCPSLSPRVCSNSCPLGRWCHPTVSSSVVPSSCLLSFPAPGCFPISWLFASGGQSIGASASASVFPMNIQGEFPLGLIGFIFLQSKRLSTVFFSTTIQKDQFFGPHPSLWSNSDIRTWLLEKIWLWLYRPLLAKWFLCFLILCVDLLQLSSQEASVFQFHNCNHHLQWFWSPRKKPVTVSTFSPSIWHDGTRCHEFSFLNVEF